MSFGRRGRVRFFQVLLAVTFLSSITAVPAFAQYFGVRAGASVDPDQFFIGGHAEVGPIVDRVWFRPNIDIGFGDDVTATTLNFEAVYRYAPPRSDWTLYGGGGPAINVYNFDNDTESEGGFNFVFGAEHQSGVFSEVKLGVGDSPDLKLGVGYTFR
jgi:hypothetical protein